MLDPFSALGLAGNIVQFVDFSAKLVSGGVELYRSADGALPKNAELKATVTDLSSITRKLQTHDQGSPQHPYSKDETALVNLSAQCKILGDKLVEVLEDLTVSGSHKKWKSVRQALRSVWKETEIQDMQKRLDSFRSQITLRLIAILRFVI